jgi:hypothetical protein
MTAPRLCRLAASALLLGIICAPGCDAAVEVSNAAPRITWVAVMPPLAPNPSAPGAPNAPIAPIAEITVWVSDLEGDAVDLIEAQVLVGGAPLADLAAAGALVAGSHGLSGLTTQEASFDANGQPHLLLWDTTGVDPGASIQLRFKPDDRRADVPGPAVVSPVFVLSEGLSEAVPVEVATP